jgi:hypothetical protein
MINRHSTILFILLIPILFIINWIVKNFSLFYDINSMIFLILNVISIILLIKGDFKAYLKLLALTISLSYLIKFEYINITYLGFVYIYITILLFYLTFVKYGKINKNNIYIFVLIIYSIIVSKYINMRLLFQYIYSIWGGFIILIIASNIKDKNFNISKFCIYLPIIFSPLFFYQILFHPIWGGIYDRGIYRIFGNNVWPNSFALYLNVIIMFTLSYYLERKKNIYLLLFILYTYFLINTFSRSGFVSFILGITVTLLLKNYKFKFSRSTILLAVILLIFVVSYNKYQDIRLFQIGKENILGERVYIWNQIASNYRGSYFLGIGLGGYETIRPYIAKGLSPHNAYIYIITNIGLVGLMLFIFYFLYIFYKIYIKMYNSDNIKYKIFARGVISSASVILIVSFSGDSPLMIQDSFIFWMVTGFMYNAK